MEDSNVEELLKIRYECEDLIRKCESIAAVDCSITVRVMIRSAQKRLKRVNSELMKRAM